MLKNTKLKLLDEDGYAKISEGEQVVKVMVLNEVWMKIRGRRSSPVKPEALIDHPSSFCNELGPFCTNEKIDAVQVHISHIP